MLCVYTHVQEIKCIILRMMLYRAPHKKPWPYFHVRTMKDFTGALHKLATVKVMILKIHKVEVLKFKIYLMLPVT